MSRSLLPGKDRGPGLGRLFELLQSKIYLDIELRGPV